jgi:transketolase
VGPLVSEYSLTSDWHERWLTGGTEADVIAEAHLDGDSIVAGIERFAGARAQRLQRQRQFLAALDSDA